MYCSPCEEAMYTEMENFEKQDFFGVCTQECIAEEESAYFLLPVEERPRKNTLGALTQELCMHR